MSAETQRVADAAPATAERRWLAPEVVQTSAMDCGPAALKCLLEGFSIPLSYGRLREACQTDVDGTSIDTLEQVAIDLGLDAVQVMLPADHLLLPRNDSLPALVVVRLPDGMTHFVVAWRLHAGGRWVQVMDPTRGRRWVRRERFLADLLLHRQPVPAGDWRDWAGSDEFLTPLRERLALLEIDDAGGDPLLADALADPGWQGLAALDAALRLTAALVRAAAVDLGPEAARLLGTLYRQTRRELALAPALTRARGGAEGPADARVEPAGLTIPPDYWSVRPLPPAGNGNGNGNANGNGNGDGKTDGDDLAGSPPPAEPEMLLLSGAVLLQVNGRLPYDAGLDDRAAAADPVRPEAAPEPSAPAMPAQTPVSATAPEAPEPPPARRLSAELSAALDEAPARPLTEIWRLLRHDGLLTPVVLMLALTLASAGVMIEALLFRGLLELGHWLPDTQYRLGAFAAAFGFLLLLALLEYPFHGGEARLGRHLENRLRMRFMAKVPRLHDRYFSSRLTSDMAHRVYELRELRDLPRLALQFLRTGFELLLTTAGLIWLHPGGAWIALAALLATAGIWLLTQPLLIEQDLNLRTHEGALSRFYLDALLGLTPIRTHSAERSVRREHEGLLVEWIRASLGFYRSFVAVQCVAALLGVAFSAWLLFDYTGSGGAPGGLLLLFYWALRLPALGQELARSLQQYPMHRNRILRLLEPLSAPEEALPAAPGSGPSAERRGAEAAEAGNGEDDPGAAGTAGNDENGSPGATTGIAIAMRGLHVQAGGHPILSDLNLSVGAGEHIAVVGPSGAGKSSLVGLLLGWHKPGRGAVLIDGAPLDGGRLARLRRETAWVDPAVQIWNRSLLANLHYGNAGDSAGRMNDALEKANLFGVLERLPDGLQTALGEGGGLVSGGEGQRVRLGRALLRERVRLVILDEPFRGLDRSQRRTLLQQVRRHWRDATLIYISHDVADSLQFDRVLVIDRGRVAEDGRPEALAARAGAAGAAPSRYRRLLDAERVVREELWASEDWRRLRLEQGVLRENRPPERPA